MTKLAVHQEYRQVYTRNGDIYDLPPDVTKQQIELQLQRNFIDVGQEFIPRDQIKSIKLNTIADEIDLMVANLKEPEKSMARKFVSDRRASWTRLTPEILDNYVKSLSTDRSWLKSTEDTSE